MLKWFQTGVVSIGAFALGIAFEKNCRLQADVPAKIDLGVDVVDGGRLDKLASGSSHVSTITCHGFPSLDSIRSFPNYVISYDRRNRVANWVLEYVTKEHLESDTYDRSNLEFVEDKSFHHFFRSTNQDYRKSGYDRGHMAAAGNYRANPGHVKETFVLSNIAPQVGRGFNRDKWNDLEKHCRKRVRQIGAAWICTGPLYLPRRESDGKLYIKFPVIGSNQVAVPTHFFKILLYQVDGRFHMESYLMPNEVIANERNIHEFRIDPEVIERAGGLLFFNHIPRNSIKINYLK